MDDELAPPSWLWRGVLSLSILALLVGIGLSVATGVGGNAARPALELGWSLCEPVALRAAAGDSQVYFVGRPLEAFVFEAAASLQDDVESAEYGLVFRAQGADRYRWFAVGGDGYLAVLQTERGTETPLYEWQQFPHVRRGRAANRLRLSCGGGWCHFWLNDEYVTALPDGPETRGEVGLWVRSWGGEPAQVLFDEVTIWEQK
ncbi:MAG: hypothetical protein JW900_10300 [Anaerolineae bacterium]|nr:hypothetical protein [Anaerolineae bacterium]